MIEPVANTVTPSMWIAGSILFFAYLLIFSEVIHRTLAGVIGAVVMVLAGLIGGFYSQADAVAAIDAEIEAVNVGERANITGSARFKRQKYSRYSPMFCLPEMAGGTRASA